jgi:GH35 family endo-1,4-beta-xylanase
VDLSAASGPRAVEGLDPRSGDTTQGQSTSGGEKRPLQPPFPGDAVLHLRSAGPQGEASTGRTPASPVLAQAARGVEMHRKGDVTIRFVRKDGTEAAGVQVEVAQRTHDFAFGNIFRPRHYRNEAYRARFLELFNFIQLLEFNWGQYETEEGKPKLADRMAFIHGWCREHGLTRFYGHMLVWSPQEDEPYGPEIPHWLFRYDRPTQDRLLKERIQREVVAYRDVDILWDVVNEAVHCRRWGDWEKQGYMDEPIPDVVPYVRDAFRWAHEANPQARLLLNDYRVIPQGKYRDRYIELIERLQNEKTPVHAIGIQAHDPYKGAYWFSPEEIWQTCERFGTRTGLPVHFTEFCYLSDPARDIRGAYRQGKWDPHQQAEAIEEFYRVAFGHPAVASITYFGMGDDDPPWLPNLCLLDKDFQPKPAWNRLKKLIKEEWNTRQSAQTDATGVYHFGGFFGQYNIRATDGGKEQTFTAHLEKGKPNVWTFTLDK